MQNAMQMVRDKLGEDAVILSTAKNPAGKGITITVAVDQQDELSATPRLQSDRQTRIISHRKVESGDIEKTLRFHGVPDYLIDKILDSEHSSDSRSRDARHHALTDLLNKFYTFEPITLNAPPSRIMLVGPPGAGKTMSVAKIAAQTVMNKEKIAVITTDTQRAGGVEQLAAFTNILEMELQVAKTRTELKRILKDIPPSVRVLIDSAGVNPYSFEELKMLGEFASLADIEPVLVAAAGGDCGEAEEITRAFSFLGIRRLLITRVDTARRFGAALTSAHMGNLAFCNASSTSRVIGEFVELDAGILAKILLKYTLEL